MSVTFTDVQDASIVQIRAAASRLGLHLHEYKRADNAGRYYWIEAKLVLSGQIWITVLRQRPGEDNGGVWLVSIHPWVSESGKEESDLAEILRRALKAHLDACAIQSALLRELLRVDR